MARHPTQADVQAAGSQPKHGLAMTAEPQSVDLLIEGGSVMTMDREGRYWPSASVVVDKGAILDVGPRTALKAAYDPRKTIDAAGMAVLPGFVNCHGHAGMSLIRGLAEEYPLEAWLSSAVWPLMRNARQEDTYAGARLACLEMLSSGITTFIDMWRDLPATVEAVATSGLRARLAFNMRDFDDARALESEWEQGFDALSMASPGSRISFGLSPHSLYACSETLLQRVSQAAAERRCHLQIHLAETETEVWNCRGRHGRGPVERLDDLGLLGPNLLVAHGVWLDENDCRRLAAAGASVAHNISSNLKLASGVAPLGRFRDSGLNFGLGTDSAASNNTLDPFREMRMATLLQRAVAEDPAAFSAYEAMEAATRNGAVAVGLAEQIGSIETGKRADLVLIDLDSPRLQPRIRPDRDALAELLVFAATARDVHTVLVDGEILVENRQVRTLDVSTVLSEAGRATRRLLERAATDAPPHAH